MLRNVYDQIIVGMTVCDTKKRFLSDIVGFVPAKVEQKKASGKWAIQLKDFRNTDSVCSFSLSNHIHAKVETKSVYRTIPTVESYLSALIERGKSSSGVSVTTSCHSTMSCESVTVFNCQNGQVFMVPHSSQSGMVVTSGTPIEFHNWVSLTPNVVFALAYRILVCMDSSF
jgi:hypothetical protein